MSGKQCQCHMCQIDYRTDRWLLDIKMKIILCLHNGGRLKLTIHYYNKPFCTLMTYLDSSPICQSVTWIPLIAIRFNCSGRSAFCVRFEAISGVSGWWWPRVRPACVGGDVTMRSPPVRLYWRVPDIATPACAWPDRTPDRWDNESQRWADVMGQRVVIYPRGSPARGKHVIDAFPFVDAQT